MDQAVTSGLDIAKSVFQAHGVNAAGEVIVRQRLTRSRLLAFFGKRSPCLLFPALRFLGDMTSN